MSLRPTTSPLFPYTTLFRSRSLHRGDAGRTSDRPGRHLPGAVLRRDRKSTRLNSSHVAISYAVFCLKKKTKAVMMNSERAWCTGNIHMGISEVCVRYLYSKE